MIGLISFQFASGQLSQVPPLDPGIGITTIALWDEAAPGALGTNPEDIPTLTIFHPHPGQGNGTAVVIAPGGAYLGLASILEGRQVADWYAAHGVTAFLLKYRLGAKYLYPIPLEDAQRAIRWVRYHSGEYNISPDRVGMAGFSAGGHLTAMTGTATDSQGKIDAIDPIDRISAKPDFLVLGYPWINAMQPSEAPFIPSYQDLLKISDERAKELELNYTPTLKVTDQTPATFIFSTTDDEVVSVHASVDFYKALITEGVSAELHIFRHGAHGSGLGSTDASLEAWPALLGQWLRGQGLLTPDSTFVDNMQ